MNFTFTGLPAVRAPRPTAWAPTQGRPCDGPTAHLRAAAQRGSGDDAMKITFTGFCGAGDDAMNITFTSSLPARAPRPAIPPPRRGGGC